MRRVIVLFVGLALVTAGCGTALLDAGPADTAAVLPGGVDFAADGTESYQLEATLGYAMDDYENDDEASGVLLGITYYFMGAVENDETPIGLQPLLQRSSDVSLDLTIGNRVPDAAGLDEDSVFGYEVSARYVMGEDMVDGLGFEFAYGKMTIGEDAVPFGTDDMERTTLDIGALYYLEGVSDSLEGLIAKLGYTSSEDDVDGDGATVSGIEIGAEYYMEVSDGIWIDAELTLGFLNMDVDIPGFSEDDDAFAYGIRVDVYPMRVLGVGFSYESRTQADDTSAANFDDQDQTVFGLHASYSLDDQGLPIDINISYSSLDIEERNGDESTIEFSVDYRF